MENTFGPTHQPLEFFLAQISTINFYVCFFNKNMSELSIFLLHLELAVAELIPWPLALHQNSEQAH